MVSKKDCPKGKILRKGYSYTRNGKKITVPAKCIEATSLSGKKRSVADKKKLAEKAKMHERVGEKYGKKKCPPGQIERVGYTRQSYKRSGYWRKNKDGTRTWVKPTKIEKTTVPPTCIKDRGEKGKGFKIPTVLKEGALKRFGYEDVRNMSVEERHKALTKAYKTNKNPLSLYRKLIVVSTMNKNTNPKVSKIFRTDANWVKKTFGLKDTKPAKEKKGSKGGGNGQSKRNSKTARGGAKKNTNGSKSTGKKSTGSKTAKK